MAECHPVGFQWVGEAKARGAKVIHIDPRFTRTSAIADLHVPLRAGSRHRVPRRAGQPRAEQRPVLPGVRRRLHERRRDPAARTSATPRTSTACSPASTRRSGTTTRRAGSTSRTSPATTASPRTSRRRRRQQERRSQTRGGQGRRRRRRPPAPAGRRCTARASGTRRCSTRARCSRSSSGTSPATRRRWCARSAASSRRSSRKVAEWVTANSGRERTTAWVYSVGWTQHTVGAQYIRTASILQALLGNIGRPGGGIMALRGHASIQGSTDIPTLFNLLPGYLPMPHAHQHDVAGRVLRRRRRHRRVLGQQARVHGQPAQGLVGRRGAAGERLLLRLPAQDRRRPQLLPHDQRHDRGQGARLLPGRGEPGGRPPQRRA